MAQKIKTFLGNWLLKRARSLLRSEETKLQGVAVRINALRNLWFLADAPLFIDALHVQRLFEAIFQPEFEVSSRTSSRGDSAAEEFASELSGGGELSLPTFFKASANIKVGTKDAITRTTGEAVVEVAVTSPERRLEKLIVLYGYSYPERLFHVSSDLVTITRSDGITSDWAEVERTLDRPGIRPLVVFDLAPDSRILPMFGEFQSGKQVELHKLLIDAVSAKLRTAFPKFPDHGVRDYSKLVEDYWRTAWTSFDSRIAMELVEHASHTEGERFAWIDYRVLNVINQLVTSIHLHIAARGEYPTGTFAYQLIWRGQKHGLRLVGTLKKGADVNVLAVYER